ncbi:MAG: FliM/FliN family flagellar motor C-terminal domain-containing protein, partial [Planctomycetota bacterium]
MIVDQSEIDSLLNQAENLATEASAEIKKPAPPPARPAPPKLPADPELARLFRLQVPVIVQLAVRNMSIAEIRQFATGAIIEFEKSVDDNLDLLINN